jgi:pilus assembly protein CpaB
MGACGCSALEPCFLQRAKEPSPCALSCLWVLYGAFPNLNFDMEEKNKMKNLLKNRIVVGLLCIITALLICFGLTPMFNDALKSKVEMVRVTTEIKKGDQITAGQISTVEAGGYNLPFDVVYKKEDVIGKYANADLYKGDYILKTKLSDTPMLKNEYLSGLDGTNRAISVTIKSFAAGLSGKL